MLKNKENVLRLIALAILVVIVIFVANYLSVNEKFYKSMLRDRDKESYSGIVSEKYVDSSEHATPMLKFKSSEVISLERNFWDQVEVGDSIVKIKNQAIITLYKDNKIKQTLNYNEYFDELIQESKKE